MLNRLAALASLFGLDVRKTVRSLRGVPPYLADRKAFRGLEEAASSHFAVGRLYPCLQDRATESGVAKGHYFHQDLLVAQAIFRRQPRRHLDVGSRVDGFVSHVASFREIEVIDIRQLDVTVPNITFMQADMMGEIPDSLHDACDSLSCLHTLEHFGLGRYGDPLDYDGHLKGLSNLDRILEKGGTLYLSVPIGPQRIEFNAQRVFSVGGLLSLLEDRFDVDRFSYVDDRGDLHADVELSPAALETSCGCTCGCGIFELNKR